MFRFFLSTYPIKWKTWLNGNRGRYICQSMIMFVNTSCLFLTKPTWTRLRYLLMMVKLLLSLELLFSGLTFLYLLTTEWGLTLAVDISLGDEGISNMRSIYIQNPWPYSKMAEFLSGLNAIPSSVPWRFFLNDDDCYC